MWLMEFFECIKVTRAALKDGLCPGRIIGDSDRFDW